jgi:uncharacterized delta-60 repeat protein
MRLASNLCLALLLAAPLAACDSSDDPVDDMDDDDTDDDDDDPLPEPYLAEATMVPMSQAGSDAFFGVAYAADGSFFAAGFHADSFESSSDRSFALAKFTAAGALDPDFGDDGIATINVAVDGAGGEAARVVALQADGKIVIGGAIEHDVEATGTAASDRDIALVRFLDSGAVDEDFGDAGVAIYDLGEGVEVEGTMGPTLSAADSLWSLTLTDDDGMVLHGATRTPAALEDAERTDSDWFVLRLDDAGEPVAMFGEDGVFTLDLSEVNASARFASVLADGSIIGAGYANTPGLGTVQPVVYKLTPDGDLDETFGEGGVFHQTVLAGQTETYGVAVVGDKLVTTGYGKTTADGQLDWVSLRLTMDGELDTTWGDDGAVVIDRDGFNDNSRAIVALPDGAVLLIGGGRADADTLDAFIAVLDGDGELDDRFGDDNSGKQVLDLGGVGDMLWNAVVAPDGSRAVMVGHKGAGSSPSADNNDDAAVLILPLE